MSVYPATNSNEAVELIIDGGNQLHDIINEAADKTVPTESGDIPSVRKAIADSLMFLEPIPWKQGDSETNFLQIRSFNSELYWAPSATVSTPKPMGVSPAGDTNWKLAPLRLSKSSILIALGKTNKGFWDENPKLENKDDFVVERSTGNVFGAITLPYQVDSATHPDPNALVPSELRDVSQFIDKYSIREYTEINYRSIDDMINGVPVETELNYMCSTGSTIYKRISVSNPPVIGDFKLVNTANVIDGGAKGDDTGDDTSAISSQFGTRKNVTIPSGYFPVSSLDLTPYNNLSVNGYGGSTVIKHIGNAGDSVVKIGDIGKPSTRNQLRDFQVWTDPTKNNIVAFDIDYFTNQSHLQDLEVLNLGDGGIGFKFGNAWFAHAERLTVVGNDNTKLSTGFLLTTANEAINGVVFENLRAHTLGIGVDLSITNSASYGCGIENYNVELCKTAFKIRSFPKAALTQFVIGGTSCYIENCETPFDIDSDISTGTLKIENAVISKNSGRSILKGKMKIIFDNCRWLKIDATDLESVCIIRDCTVDELIDPNNKVVVINSEELNVDSVCGQTQGNQGVNLYPIKKGRIPVSTGTQVTTIPNAMTRSAPSGGFTTKLEIFAYRAVDLTTGKKTYAEVHKKNNSAYGLSVLAAISSNQDGAWTVSIEELTGDIKITSNLNGDHYFQYVWHLY